MHKGEKKRERRERRRRERGVEGRRGEVGRGRGRPETRLRGGQRRGDYLCGRRPSHMSPRRRALTLGRPFGMPADCSGLHSAGRCSRARGPPRRETERGRRMGKRCVWKGRGGVRRLRAAHDGADPSHLRGRGGYPLPAATATRAWSRSGLAGVAVTPQCRLSGGRDRFIFC